MVHTHHVVDQREKKEKKYPKCVPLAKARGMSASRRSAAVRRKQAKI